MIDDVKTDGQPMLNRLCVLKRGHRPLLNVLVWGQLWILCNRLAWQICDHEMDMLRYGHQRLASVQGLNFIGMAAGKSGVISFTLDTAHPHDISTLIDQDGVAIRAGHRVSLDEIRGLSSTARASVGVYTKNQILMCWPRRLKKLTIFG